MPSRPVDSTWRKGWSEWTIRLVLAQGSTLSWVQARARPHPLDPAVQVPIWVARMGTGVVYILQDPLRTQARESMLCLYATPTLEEAMTLPFHLLPAMRYPHPH